MEIRKGTAEAAPKGHLQGSTAERKCQLKNVYQKILDVMSDVAYLTKDDRVETGNGKFYKAITEEKVTGAVRAALIKHGLVILPIRQTSNRTDEKVIAFDKFQKRDVEKINRITTVDVEYRIQNVEDKDDFITVQSSGTGVDTQDKGVGKAMTYAYKYMLLRSFAIPTGEDADKISSDLYTEALTGEKERGKVFEAQQASNDEFQSFIAAETEPEKPCTKVQLALIRKACDAEQERAICKSRKVAALEALTAKQAEGVINGLIKTGRLEQ